jgi:hypothetical protein
MKRSSSSSDKRHKVTRLFFVEQRRHGDYPSVLGFSLAEQKPKHKRNKSTNAAAGYKVYSKWLMTY